MERDEVRQEPASTGFSDFRGLSWLLACALALRLMLLPLCHVWDGQTWGNVLAELSQPGSPLEAVQRPYETMRELSLLTRGAMHRQHEFYEYWAYPPGMLYLYWPLGQMAAAIAGPLAPSFPAQPAFVVPTIPLWLLFLARLPVLVADLAILLLMRALGVGRRQLWMYAFNPFVLLVGVWTFDAVMAALLLGGVMLAERGRWGLAGIALGLGGAVKFLPLVVVPALLLVVLRLPVSTGKRLAAGGLLLGGAAAGFLIPAGPVLDGVRYVLGFHLDRFGLGLTVHEALRSGVQAMAAPDWQPVLGLYVLSALGGIILLGGLIVAALALSWRWPTPRAGALVMLCAFLASSKLVNEPYALAVVALLVVVAGAHPSRLLSHLGTLLWVTALAYAAINTPIWTFGFTAIQALVSGSASGLAFWMDAFRVYLTTAEAGLPLAVLGVTFNAALIVAAIAAYRADQAAAPAPTRA